MSRLRDFLARHLHRPAPAGHFVAGSKFSWHGALESVPGAPRARPYLLYLPRGFSRWTRHPLVVFIHGCNQTPEDFAAGTRIASLADKHGWVVLMPRQTGDANPIVCWNWFDRATAAGNGEAAIVVAQIRSVALRYRVYRSRIFAVGMSAGAALAATLGVRHPDLFAGVFVHSGLACGAASNPSAAFEAMAKGPDTDCADIGAKARAAEKGTKVRLPLFVIQGDEDKVVAPVNAGEVVRQYLALNGVAVREGHQGDPPLSDGEAHVALGDGRSMRVSEYRDGRRIVARLARVPLLGHAWSGGDPAYAFNDPRAPDATALLGEFVSGRLRP